MFKEEESLRNVSAHRWIGKKMINFFPVQIGLVLSGCSAALERWTEDDFIFLPRITLSKNDARHKGKLSAKNNKFNFNFYVFSLVFLYL